MTVWVGKIHDSRYSHHHHNKPTSRRYHSRYPFHSGSSMLCVAVWARAHCHKIDLLCSEYLMYDSIKKAERKTKSKVKARPTAHQLLTSCAEHCGWCFHSLRWWILQANYYNLTKSAEWCLSTSATHNMQTTCGPLRPCMQAAAFATGSSNSRKRGHTEKGHKFSCHFL